MTAMAIHRPCDIASLSQSVALPQLQGHDMKQRPDGLATRKLRHIDVCLTGPVDYVGVTTGFEWFDLPYNALTQTHLAAIDLSTRFLGFPLKAPVLIGAMTGGAELACTINRNLAAAAQELGIGMMLGSQRIMLDDLGSQTSAATSFEVRDLAPTCC